MIEPTSSLDFVVSKQDLARAEVRRTPSLDFQSLRTGSLLVRVTKFAFTSNNITYAKLGDAMKYWTLFPRPDGYGNIPVWGYGEVAATRHPDISEGERIFGYFPMATDLIVEATDVTKRGLRDAAPHRQNVAPAYNAYARVTGIPEFAGRQGDYQALLRPLFMLSFLVDAELAEKAFFGAQQILLSSASSKTAFGLAHLLSQRKQMKVVGLTSAQNADFVSSLGCYDDVVLYEHIEKMAGDTPTAFVDLAGSFAIRTRVHQQFGERIVYSGLVGLTHNDAGDASAANLPGALPTWFFAPDHIRKRAKEWGSGGIERRLGAAWATLVPRLDDWINVIESHGEDAVREIYLATLHGSIEPSQAHMLSLS